MPKKQITLPPIYIGEQPPTGDFSLGRSWGASAPSIPEAMRFGPFMYHTLQDWEKSFQTSLDLIDSVLEQELSAARGGVSQDANTIEGLQRELVLRAQLMEKKRTEIQQVSAAADRFYGTDPLSLTPKQQMDVVIRFMNSHPRPRELHGFAQTSHEAAYKRRFAQEALGKLADQAATFSARVAEMQKQVAAEAAARAAEQAQVEAAARAAEQAQAEAATRAVEQAQAETERLREEQRLEQIAQNIFQINGATTEAGAQLATTAGRVLAADGATLTLQASIRASITALAELAAGAASGLLVGVGALIYPSRLGNGELPNRYALMLPLTDLTTSQITEINHGPIDLPVRLGFKSADSGHTEIIVIPADGAHVSRSVRVIAAAYDSALNVYSISTPDIPPKTLIWTPIVNPGNSSTALPADIPEVPVYEGAILTPVAGRIDTYPELDDVEIDDYIFIFPADSGLPALYAVFQSPRNMPGVVSGEGQTVFHDWLEALAEGEGAPIPKQIAEQLRGKQFSNFSRFREAFWKLVADDELLVNQFSSENKVLMQKGYAPYTPKKQSVGERRVFEIHHIDFISNGAAVYDVNNMRILTPARHIKLHSEVKHG
ncbi:HNH nuclease [Pseudomonas cichorii]|uniref:S-type pyocin domain-containing protein n=1 Tax=Pseudomonas cichorii TaxID=36746 RepID=UPI0019103984|nr:S-type pyocin domain-containing protein [Pseudomonas cichorii]GFM86638.1 HNH nuclease [Pseudomonas cichorii]